MNKLLTKGHFVTQSSKYLVWLPFWPQNSKDTSGSVCESTLVQGLPDETV